MKQSDIRREREARRREVYREMILHAAERVILRKGYSALTMDDVAREAQLSKATIYKYVSGKGTLLFEILGHSFDDIRLRMAEIADGPGSAREKLGRIVQAILQGNEDMMHFNQVLWMDKAMLKLMRLFAHPPGRPGAAPAADRKMLIVIKRKRQELIDIGARILEEGVESGEFGRMDTAQAADYIDALLQGYTHIRLWQGDAPRLPAAAEDLTRFIIEGIRNPKHSGKEI